MANKSAPKKLTELLQQSVSSLFTRGELQRSASTQVSPSDELNKKVALYRGDITALEVGAIVNAANKQLRGGGGVDGAIHSAAGPGLLEACRPLNGCPTGDAKITDGFKLPAKHVIHTAGPIYNARRHEQNEDLLASCYKRSLEVAVENNLKSVAFSCISTGVYGFPGPRATEIALSEVRKFLEGPDGAKLDLVVFCIFLQKDWDLYIEKTPTIFPESPAQAEGEAGADLESRTSGGADKGAEGSMVEKDLLPAEE